MAKSNQTEKRSKLSKSILIKASALLIIGVLFCLSTLMGAKTLSLIIGIALIVEGVIFCVLTFAKEKSFLAPAALCGALSVSFGVYVIISNAVAVIFSLIPLVLIPFGALFLADAFVGKYKRKSESTFTFVVKILIGVAGIALGLCLLFIKGFDAYAALVLGIALIAFSLYILIAAALGKKQEKE